MVYTNQDLSGKKKIMSIDPYKKNAYSQTKDGVTFDIAHLDKDATDLKFGEKEYDPEVSPKKTQSKDWELDVRALISSRKWLQNYGLKRNRLTLYQILPVIGFKLSDDFDRTLKRPVSSRYGTGLFNQLFHPGEGKTFNITCGREMLQQIEGRLSQAINLFTRRLEWLTVESRRVFGVVEEKAITIVLDIRNLSPQQFDQYRIALEQVIFEQVTQVAKFNLIRSADDMQLYYPECVPVTHDTIQGAVDWVWNLDRLASVSKTATCEAVLRAMLDQNNEAVYLFTEGTSIESCKEILKGKVLASERKIPVHAISYNCDSSDTIRFLRDFANSVRSKFHAYAVIMEMDSYEGVPLDPKTNRANIVLKKKTFGGVPAGAGMREDVMLIFEELEEARNIRAQIQALIEEVPEPKIQIESKINKEDQNGRQEQYMGTKEWLRKYGLGARKLELFDVLASVAFKHQDGAVDIQLKPAENTQTDAITRTKLVNARYCDRFPIVKWKDGKVVHVQVTPELHRNYERRMTVALSSYHQRIDWLNQGSRALFGTVIEDQMYVLIDTSASMLPNIQYLKDKLFLLMQEQLRHKTKFNLVAFNSKATAWQNRMVDVSELSLQGAWKWIQGLSCWGSTNTYAALQHALSDPGTQAIYLLTDGRPDQPPKSIIAQVQMQHCVPVHAISFNCNDTEANQFLFDLAKATGGRYHYYCEKGIDQEQPESWESEDIRLLKEEISRGLESLDKVEELRDECSNLSWKKEVEAMKKCSKNHVLSGSERESAVPSLDPCNLYRSTPSPPPRPKSAPPPQSSRSSPAPSKSARASLNSEFRPMSAQKSQSRPKSAKAANKMALSAIYQQKMNRHIGHTKTSMLRTLSSSGRFSPDEWLLPETRHLFETQAERQKQLALDTERKEKARKFRKKKIIKANENSSKLWLSRNGLIAKKLTILDALSPTMVPHKTKYVPILDKHVVSKVFDEILPLAHVSSRAKQQITLVNPCAVDMKSYQIKVQACVDKCRKRLDKIVWEALPESVQRDFDSIEPVSFENNRLRMMKALDDAGWPIKEQDILLLEQEITRGEKYIQQAGDLMRASNPRREDSFDDLVKSRSRTRSVSSSSSSSSSSSKSNRSHRSHSSHSSRSNSRSGSRASRSASVERRVNNGDNEDDDLNVYDDRASVVSSLTANSNRDDEGQRHNCLDRKIVKPKIELIMDQKDLPQNVMRRVLDTLKGQSVIARREADGLYYPGVVQKCPDTRHAFVEFADKEQVLVPTRLIIATSGAIARPHLRIGDCVLVRVINSDSKLDCYAPGIVQVTPVNEEAQAKFYTVLMYNGQQATTMRNSIMKISKSRFEFAIRYIAEIQAEDQDRIDDNVYVQTPRSDRSSNHKKRGRQSYKDRHRHRKRTPSPEIPLEIPEDDQLMPLQSAADRNLNYSRPPSCRPEAPTPNTARTGRTLTPVLESLHSPRSRSRSKSPAESTARSKSQNSARSKSNSKSRSRSRSQSPANSKSRSRSNSGERDETRSRSRSQSRSRSRSNSRSSRSRSRSKSSSSSRSQSIDLKHRSESMERRAKKSKKLKQLKKQLKQQQDEHDRQQYKIQKQAKKLKKLKKKLKKKKKKEYSSGKVGTQTVMVEVESSNDSSDHEGKDKSDSASITAPIVAPGLLQLRKTLPHLREGEEVLARWSDEGWYFRGIVKQDCGDYSYIVEDSTRLCERIWREDIITDYDDANHVIQPKDPVVALHPHYSFSYAPGVALEVYHNLEMKIRFYDGEESRLTREDIFKLTPEKFDHDVNYIIECETRWVNQAVVARDDRTGTYHLASIKERIGNGREYVVEWCDADQATQTSHHIFGVFTKHHPLSVGDHVLAMWDSEQHVYLPGWVAGIVGHKINIKFCDGSIRDVDDMLQCFWLSSDYYENAVLLYKRCQTEDSA